MSEKNKKKDIKEGIEKTIDMTDKVVKEKVMPKIKGYEIPLLVVLVVMALAGLSSKSLFFGVIFLLFFTAPKIMDKLGSKKDKEVKEETKSKKKEE